MIKTTITIITSISWGEDPFAEAKSWDAWFSTLQVNFQYTSHYWKTTTQLHKRDKNNEHAE